MHPDIREPLPDETNAVAKQVVDCAFRVHSALGSGLLESVYETCLAHEIMKKGLTAERQVVVPIVYDNIRLEEGFRIDMVVGKCVVVELKAVEEVLAVHKAQLLTYLRLSGHRIGLLINFNVPLIREGIIRIVL